MTLQEIQYKAQAIMQEWRDEDSAPYVEFVEELALMDVPEPPEDPEEAAYKYADTICPVEYPESFNDEQLRNAFIAGAEYQRKQDQQIIELAEDHAMLAGMNKMKEEMMEKAMEGEVIGYDDGTGKFITVLEDLPDDSPYKVHDKVKLIVIPEEK